MTVEDILEVIRNTNILQPDTVGLIVYVVDQVYQFYLDVDEAVKYYSANAFTVESFMQTLFEFYDDSILEYVINGIGVG